MGLRPQYGVNRLLEEEADQLLWESLKGVTSREEKSDILTPWKQDHRWKHEVLTPSGAQVDPAVRIGQFNRAYNPRNPHLNSCDGPTRPVKRDTQFDHYEGDGGAPVTLSAPMASVVGVERLN